MGTLIGTNITLLHALLLLKWLAGRDQEVGGAVPRVGIVMAILHCMTLVVKVIWTSWGNYLVSEWGCSTACQNKNGCTPLHEACRDGHLTFANILLTTQDCSAACKEHSRILVQFSCHHSWLSVTRRLVEYYHCDPECRDKDGDTPLHEACCKGHVDIVRYRIAGNFRGTKLSRFW